mmetsp:Transcript_150612/g.419840  ORF Transcript_150612/g.419840 Transcript_150612/m.419840 type:complete len:208 (+) Transcript_150612:935-1558(+)
MSTISWTATALGNTRPLSCGSYGGVSAAWTTPKCRMSAAETTKFVGPPQSAVLISAMCPTSGNVRNHRMTATKVKLANKFSTSVMPAPCQCGPHVFGMGCSSRTSVFTGLGMKVEKSIPSMSSTNVRAAAFSTKSLMYGVVESHIAPCTSRAIARLARTSITTVTKRSLLVPMETKCSSPSCLRRCVPSRGRWWTALRKLMVFISSW